MGTKHVLLVSSCTRDCAPWSLPATFVKKQCAQDARVERDCTVVSTLRTVFNEVEEQLGVCRAHQQRTVVMLVLRLLSSVG